MATVLKDQDYDHQLSDEEARELFERHVQALLNLSTDEFLMRYNAGEFKGRLGEPAFMSILALLPIIQQT